MSPKEYISSGLLELYVSGALSEQESRKITQLVNTHPELKAEVILIERAFIQFAEKHAPGSVSASSFDSANFGGTGLKLKDSAGVETAEASRKESKADSAIHYMTPVWMKTLLAASLILLAGSGFLQYQKSQALDAAQREIAVLNAEKTRIAGEFETQKADFDKTKEQFAAVRNPGTKPILLSGTKVAPTAVAVVYWNSESQEVLVDGRGLPKPPAGREYQLWTLTSLDPLTPKDAGMLTGFENNSDGLFKTKDVEASVAFAITLEPLGGSEGPTLDQLYVMGAIE